MIESVLDDDDRLFQGEGFLHEIIGTELYRLYCRLDVPVTRDHDRGNVVLLGPNLRERLHPIHSGQPDVHDDQIVGVLVQTGYPPFRAGFGVHRVALVLQHTLQGATDARLIIDYQDAFPGHVTSWLARTKCPPPPDARRWEAR